MKKFGMIMFSLLIIACLAIDVFYLYIYFTAPEKVISQTYEVGAQTITKVDGTTESKHFVELNYYSNSDKTGYEVFEVKFNYLLDERQDAFYSQGLQYFVIDENKNLDFKNKNYDYYYISESPVSEEHLTVSHNYFYDAWHEATSYKNMSFLNYMSNDNYETTVLSSNPINIDTKFKVQLGDEVFLMKFKGVDETKKLDLTMGLSLIEDRSEYAWLIQYFALPTYHRFTTYYNNYACIDLSYFVELLYNSIQPLPYGTEAELVFEFADLFDYYSFDEEKSTFSENTVSSDQAAKIVADIKSYYSIKINIHEEGLTSAENSMFNCFNGDLDFVMDNENSFEDYTFGKTILSVAEDNFEMVFEDVNSSEFKLKLNDKFVKKYSKYSSSLLLNIVIDFDQLDTQGKTFAGFAENAFSKFTINKIWTIENGEKTEFGGALC